MKDVKMGKHLTLVEFCECTETYKRFASEVNPLPSAPGSLEALQQLGVHVLDPIIDHYGRGRFHLVYGFCSNELRLKLQKKNPETQKPFGRVAPKVDQHMAMETINGTAPYCKNEGAAADFRVSGESSRSVVSWIIENRLPFDSLYFYGDDRAIHISYGPQNRRQIWAFSEKKMPTKRPIRDLVARAREVYGGKG